MIPAPDEPVSRIWAEAPTEEEAQELAERYQKLVEEVVADGTDNGE